MGVRSHLFLVLVLASLLLPAQAQRIDPVQTKPGSLDLSTLQGGGYVKLTCLWDFWPNSFVDPEKAALGEAPMEVSATAHWNQLGIARLRSTGYATYHLRITGLPLKRTLGLKVTCPLSAARVFANGEEIVAMGRPSTSAATERPRWDSAVVALEPDRNGVLDLVIYVSNYVDFSGGLAKPILLGDYSAVWAVRTSLVTLEMFELGALAVIGFYLILLFTFRPTEKYAMYFGLLALVLSFRTLCYDEFVLLTLLPKLPFPILFRSGYLTFSIPFALLAAFFRLLFPRQMHSWVYIAITALSAAFSLFIVFAPLRSVVWVLYPMEFAAMAFLAYALPMLARALVARVPGAALVLVGLILFAISMVNDILVTNGNWEGEYLTPFGLILFFLTLAFMITRNSARALRSREVLFIKEARDRISLSEKGLSATEIAYATEMLGGKSVKEIAFRHDVSESTVRNSLARVYGKLGVTSMSAFVSLGSQYDIRP
jgi:DNA-binding CsgD family transcriptional regulator